MSYTLKELKESNKTLLYIKHNILRLMKIQNRIHKINRNCYGINRGIESMIHIAKESLSKTFVWLDKSYYQLKKDINERTNFNSILISKGYTIPKE